MKKILFLLAILPMFLMGCSKENEDGNEDIAFTEPNTAPVRGAFAGYLSEMQDEYDVMGLNLYKRDYFGVALSSMRIASDEFVKVSKTKDDFNKKIETVSLHLEDGIEVSTISGLSYPSSQFTKEQKNRLSYYKNALTNLKSQVQSHIIK